MSLDVAIILRLHPEVSPQKDFIKTDTQSNCLQCATTKDSFNCRSNMHVALIVRDVEAGEEAEEAMEVSISEDPAEAEAQETTQAVGVIFAAVRKHFLLDVPIGTAMC